MFFAKPPISIINGFLARQCCHIERARFLTEPMLQLSDFIVIEVQISPDQRFDLRITALGSFASQVIFCHQIFPLNLQFAPVADAAIQTERGGARVDACFRRTGFGTGGAREGLAFGMTATATCKSKGSTGAWLRANGNG